MVSWLVFKTMAAVRKAYEKGVALVLRVKRIFKTDSRKDAWPVAKHLFYFRLAFYQETGAHFRLD